MIAINLKGRKRAVNRKLKSRRPNLKKKSKQNIQVNTVLQGAIHSGCHHYEAFEDGLKAGSLFLVARLIPWWVVLDF